MARATPVAGRMPIRWGLLLLGLAALAAIVWLRKSEPTFAEKLEPFVVAGQVGERVEARNFAVRVKRVKLARAYLTQGRSYGQPPLRVAPAGIWMSVLTEAQPLREPGYISAWLRTRDGRTYVSAPSDRPRLAGGMNFGQQQLGTGLTGTGAYFFDVPEHALQGARLQFFWGLSKPGDMDHVIEIDPGLDAATVARLRSEAPPVLNLVP